MTTDREQTIIESLSPDIGKIRLTKTMLDKHIIDANTSIRKLALLLGHDMDSMTNGDKITIEGQYDDGTPCRVNLYRTIMRSDRRISLSGIKKQARVGDLLALSYKRTGSGEYILIVNVTAQATSRERAVK